MGVDGGRARVITAVDVTPGEVGDEVLLDRLCKEHERTTGRTLAEVTADAKYGTAANYRLLEAAGIRASIPVHEAGPPPHPVPRTACTYDAEGDRFLCPTGQPLARQGWSGTVGTSGGIIYRASPKACAACPRKPACCPTAQARTITRITEDGARTRARVYLQTGHAKISIRRRKCWAESAMAELKDRHGLRRARGRGRRRVQIEALGAAIAYNVKKLARSTVPRRHAPAVARRRPGTGHFHRCNTIPAPLAGRSGECGSPFRPATTANGNPKSAKLPTSATGPLSTVQDEADNGRRAGR